MYKEFYGFTLYPFALTPDPQFLYLSENHENCLLYLLSGLEREHGIIVLTGEIGTGKTLLLHSLVKRLGKETYVAFLVHSKLNSVEVLQYAYHEFSLEVFRESKGELLIYLRNFIVSHSEEKGKFIIVVDEAQNLSADVLEELRLLTNFETSEKKLIQIILAGQPKLEDTLQLKELEQLRQRIGIHCRLTSMDAGETHSYIERRLSIAGATYPVFTSEAVEKIFVYSKGVPRVINLICDLALFAGCTAGERQIGPMMVKRVAENLRLYAPENPALQYITPQRDANEAHASGITWPQETPPLEFSAPSPDPQSMEESAPQPSHRDIFHNLISQKMREQEQIEQRLRQRGNRLALKAGIALLSLLGAGIVLQGALTSGKLREYTTSAAPSPLGVLPPSPGWREAPILPPSPGWREAPILPPSPGWREPPKKVQWAQTTISYQLPTGKPVTVPLPQLQRTPENLSVRVTLEASANLPVWLKFDPEKLTLSGIAPATELGKTYHLTFRAHTADGLASLLQFAVTLITQARP